MNYNHDCSVYTVSRYGPCSTCCVTGMLLMHGYVMCRLLQAPVCIMLYSVAAVATLVEYCWGCSQHHHGVHSANCNT